MKRFLANFQFLIIGASFFTALMRANEPGTTMNFSPPLMNGIISSQSSAYNSADNQFFFTWLGGGPNNINCVIYDTSGTVVIAQATISGSSRGAPSVSYNSANNQYLVTWLTSEIAFATLDATGNTIVASGTSTPGAVNGNMNCCYNSVNNQYCITWTSQIGSTSFPYFALINADGTVALGATQIPNVAGQAVEDATDSFVSYNAQNNQYLFTWLSLAGSTGNTAFAIYDAAGNIVGSIVVNPNVITQDPSLSTRSHPPYSCYNSLNNQYFIAWDAEGTDGLLGYFAIINNRGNVVVPTTQIATASQSYSAPVCTYNPGNNQYFVTWNDSNAQVFAAIFDAMGNPVDPEVAIPLRMNPPNSLVFNSFSTQDNVYFITWYAAGGTCAYFNLFTSSLIAPEPPTTLVGTRRLNRFVNYGEYVVQLSWFPSSSAGVVSYQIYSGATLLATVPASMTTYVAHNQPSTPTTYSVQAVLETGVTSSPVSITV